VHEIELGDYTRGRKTAGDAVRFAWELPRLASGIRRVIVTHGIDVLYVNGPRLLPAAALGRRPIVFHVHSLLRASYARMLAGLALRRDALVIASSHFVARPLAGTGVQVVYNGVADVGQAKACATNANTVGIVGRVSAEKGHPDFARAAALLPGCHWVAYGDHRPAGWPLEFRPWQDNIADIYAELDVLAVPSAPFEATPRVIMEAFSAGVPVVAYPSGGIRELIESGVNGLLTEDRTPEALAGAIRSLVENPDLAARLSRAAREGYERRFTLDRYRREVAGLVARMPTSAPAPERGREAAPETAGPQ